MLALPLTPKRRAKCWSETPALLTADFRSELVLFAPIFDNIFLVLIFLLCLEIRALEDNWGQGFGVGVETGVGVGQSRPFCLELESELESVEFCRLRLRPGVTGFKP